MTNPLPNLEAYWMPFTGNRYFKKNPRMFKRASGMFYTSYDDEKILDGISGLWCCNAGHCHPKIVEAVQKQAATLDYATAFQFSAFGDRSTSTADSTVLFSDGCGVASG